jgi:hypothetical protein
MTTPRQRFIDYVRRVPGADPIVSPFLPKPELLEKTLRYYHLPITQDPVEDEIRTAQVLEYEPMFMIEYHSQLYGEMPPDRPLVTTEAGIQDLIARLKTVPQRQDSIRKFFRTWRERVGENGVIVVAHPQVGWLSGNISQENMFLLEIDYPQTFAACAEAIIVATLQVNEIAIQEGIDFTSEGSFGLELVSPAWYQRYDLAYLPRMTAHTHAHGGLFWYHNCGKTRELIRRGYFNQLGSDVIETISPPPEGNNDLAEARRMLDPAICTKGNLSLILLREGSVEDIEKATRKMVQAVDGYAHIYSTADSPYGETPVENFIAFVRTARNEAEKLTKAK